MVIVSNSKVSNYYRELGVLLLDNAKDNESSLFTAKTYCIDH